MEKNAKIFVAGHQGLVGSAIWNKLRAKGYNNLIGKTSAELDLRDQSKTSDFFAAEKPGYVFIAAAKVGGILANDTYRADFIYDNLMIQNNIIYQAWQHKVTKLLFLGSTCIYPKNCPQPMKEEYLLTGELEPTNEPYAVAKIAGIKLCESFNRQYGSDFIAAMPTNLYGPNDNFDLEQSHVLPALLRRFHLAKLLESNDFEAIAADFKNVEATVTDDFSSREAILRRLKKIGIELSHNGAVSVQVWGSGKPLREFMWSEDMADACVFLMENISAAELAALKPGRHISHINIGTGIEISIGSLAQLCKSIVGFQGNISFDHNKPDGTMRKLTDPSLLQQLGWRHKVDLNEGVQSLYEWYRSSF